MYLERMARELEHLPQLVSDKYRALLSDRWSQQWEGVSQRTGLALPGVKSDWKDAILIVGVVPAIAGIVDRQLVVTATEDFPTSGRYANGLVKKGDKITLRDVIPDLQMLRYDLTAVRRRGRDLEQLGMLPTNGSILLKDADFLTRLAEMIESYRATGREIVVNNVHQDKNRLAAIIEASDLIKFRASGYDLKQSEMGRLAELISQWKITADELQVLADQVESFRESYNAIAERETERV